MASSPETKASRVLQSIATVINDVLEDETGQPMGFALVVFNQAVDRRSSYVSNCNREDVTEALQELLQHWESGNPDVPLHELN
jgi:hypothetical protein